MTCSQERSVPSQRFCSPLPWYGIRTKPNQEKLAATCLRNKGFDHYLPLCRHPSPRSDRVAKSERPLFRGYIFCRFDASRRLPVITTPGVVSVVGFGKEPAPIPDEEIKAIRLVMESGFAAKPCPFLKEGQRVCVTHGPIKGVHGILVDEKSELRMIISVTMMQRSVSVEIGREEIATV